MGRIGNFLAATPAPTAPSCCKRDQLAHAADVPHPRPAVVYYGDEQGFTGDGGDKDARQDMFASQVAVVQRRRPASAPTRPRPTTTSTRRTRCTSSIAALADAARRAPGARRRRPAAPLRQRTPPASTPSAGSTRRERVEYLVAVNNATSREDGRRSPRRRRARRSAGLWPAAPATLRADREARVTVTVPALSAVVWRADRRVPGSRPAPAG